MIIRITRIKIFTAVLLFVCVCFGAGIYTGDITVSAEEKIPLPIVMYHQLTTVPSRAGKYTVTVEQFEDDLKFIKESGYETISTAQLLEFLQGASKLPEKPVMIIFDDGYETVYKYALPLLEKYDMRISVAVIGSCADLFTIREDHHLKYSYMNWNEIKELTESGRVEILNHSYDLHSLKNGRKGMRKLNKESVQDYKKVLEDDLMKLQNKCLENLNAAPEAVVYPYGEYSDESADILKELGFKAAFICEEKVNFINSRNAEFRLFRLGRFNRASGKSSEDFFAKLGINKNKI